MGCVVLFIEKQTCITGSQPSELFDNAFIQIVLSLLACVKPSFSVN